MKKSKIYELEQELHLAEEEINAAARAFDIGQTLKLDTLGQRIESICVQLFEISPTDAQRLGSRLPYLAKLLDEVAQKINCKAQKAIPDSRTQHKKAVQAYANQSSRKHNNY